MKVGVRLRPLLQSLQEAAVVGLEHFKRDDQGKQSAGNAKVIQADVEESQYRLAPPSGGKQQRPDREGSDYQNPMRSIARSLTHQTRVNGHGADRVDQPVEQ